MGLRPALDHAWLRTTRPKRIHRTTRQPVPIPRPRRPGRAAYAATSPFRSCYQLDLSSASFRVRQLPTIQRIGCSWLIGLQDHPDQRAGGEQSNHPHPDHRNDNRPQHDPVPFVGPISRAIRPMMAAFSVTRAQKKADLARHAQVLNQVGLLVNGPSAAWPGCPLRSLPTPEPIDRGSCSVGAIDYRGSE